MEGNVAICQRIKKKKIDNWYEIWNNTVNFGKVIFYRL